MCCINKAPLKLKSRMSHQLVACRAGTTAAASAKQSAAAQDCSRLDGHGTAQTAKFAFAAGPPHPRTSQQLRLLRYLMCPMLARTLAPRAEVQSFAHGLKRGVVSGQLPVPLHAGSVIWWRAPCTRAPISLFPTDQKHSHSQSMILAQGSLRYPAFCCTWQVWVKLHVVQSSGLHGARMSHASGSS